MTMITNCPLCDDNRIRPEQIPGRAAVSLSCPRCGQFAIPSGRFHIKAAIRSLLSIYTRTRSALGESAMLSSDNVETLAQEMESISLETKTKVLIDYLSA